MVTRFKLLPTVVAVVALTLVGTATPAQAQELPDSVRVELERLRVRLDSLEALVRRLQGAGREPEAAVARDALADLRAAAQAAAGGVAADTVTGPDPDAQFSGRQRSMQALNPEISINADILAHMNTGDPGQDNFAAREFEISFQSALDPYSRAKVFLVHHAGGPEFSAFESEEGGEEEPGGTEVEEGFVEWVGLPAGLSLKFGKFFQRFGTLNRWHGHALPFQSRSLPHLAYIGEESLSQAGASLSWILPIHGFGTYDATFEVTRSSNGQLFGESVQPSYLGHVNAFWQLGSASDLDLGLSWINGSYETDAAAFARNLIGIQAAYTWRPPARSRYRELVVRGGAMILDGLVPTQGVAAADGSALGLWSLAEFRLNQQWLVGARLDRAENPLDTEQTAWLGAATLTWWQSEYVRLRLEYDVLNRSMAQNEHGRLWLQVTFAMGPHKHETY